MPKLFKNKKIIIGILVIFILSFFVFNKFQNTYADTSLPLSCTITTGACGGVVVLKMQALSNSHAELNNQSNYSYKLCCQGTDISNACTGTYAVALKLSGNTNAHVEEGGQTTYANSVCLSYAKTGGTITCAYASDCATLGVSYVCLASISSATNGHIGECSAYATKVCCATTTPPPTPLPKWRETN